MRLDNLPDREADKREISRFASVVRQLAQILLLISRVRLRRAEWRWQAGAVPCPWTDGSKADRFWVRRQSHSQRAHRHDLASGQWNARIGQQPNRLCQPGGWPSLLAGHFPFDRVAKRRGKSARASAFAQW